RDRPGQQAADPAAPRPYRRARSRSLPRLAAPAGGGDHLDPQAPARPGPSRRPDTLRAVGPPRPGSLPRLAPPAGGGDHLDPQAPARPGPSRRPHPLGAVGPRRPAPARPQRGDLVQLADRRPTKRSLIAYDH